MTPEGVPSGPADSRRGVGRWLFTQRGWLPLPLLGAQLLLGHEGELSRWGAGVGLIAAGELGRIAGVAWIGRASRTRASDTWGPVRAGPYGWVRNPLYLANGLLWLGVGVVSGPAFALMWAAAWLAIYPSIVAWEEENLAASLGPPYLAYLQEVPRWWPRPPGERVPGAPSWGEALRSERSTLLAIAAVLGALALRQLSGLGPPTL